MSIDQSVLDKFEAVVESQRKRIMDMKAQDDFIDYSKLDKLIIGVCGGDGIGPMITGMAQHALEVLLADKVKAGKVEFRVIDGLTIERRAELGCAIPPDVMEQLKQCHVILKGPTTTPRKGDPWPNVESANVAMRKASRPVRERPSGKGSGARHRLDVLPREHRGRLRCRLAGRADRRRSVHRLHRCDLAGLRAHRASGL